MENLYEWETVLWMVVKSSLWIHGAIFLKKLLFFFHRKDDKDYALKQIEGTGISMSACREIAVSNISSFY